MMRILVIDDDASAVDALQTLLDLDGFEAKGVGSAIDGIELLERESFEVVITDLEMPGANGVDVVRTAKKHQPNCVILVVSAYDRSTTADDALAAGAHRVFGKPIAYDELERELSAIRANSA